MKKSWLVPGIVGFAAAIVYFVSAVDCAGLHLIAPVCGVVAVVTVFHLVRLFVAANLSGEGGGNAAPTGTAGMPPRPVAVLAGVVAAAVFMFTPAVRSAATHFEPRLLDFTWALLIVALAVPFLSRRARASRAPGLYPVLAGSAVAFGLLDSALFLALAPLYLVLAVCVARRARDSHALDATRSSGSGLFSRPAFSVPLFFLAAISAFFVAACLLRLDLKNLLCRTLVELTSYYRTPGWLFVFFFTTLPFLAVLFSEDGALRERPGFVQLLFHGALSFVTILAVVPPLSPSALMAPYGRLPVATSAFAAFVAGYLVAYWWTNRRMTTARVLGGILVLVLAGTSVWSLFTFDAKAGIVRRVVVRMDAARAQEILRKDPDSPIANYVVGSLALKAGKNAEAESRLRKAALSPRPVPFALNDYAEVLRRGGNYAEAERFARRCVACAPNMYVGWETLGSILMDAGGHLDEAESAIRKACELSRGENGKPSDIRMLVSLARVQLKRGDAGRAEVTIREIRSRQNELSDFERAEFERLVKDARHGG